MKKSYKRMSGILAVFLAITIFLNNEGIYSVFAAENNANSESGHTSSAPIQSGTVSSGEGTDNGDATSEGSGTNETPSGGGNGTGETPSGGGSGTGETPSGGGSGTGEAPSGGGNGTNETPSGGGNEAGETPSGGSGMGETPSGEGSGTGENGTGEIPSNGGNGTGETPSGEGSGAGETPPEDGNGEDETPSGDEDISNGDMEEGNDIPTEDDLNKGNGGEAFSSCLEEKEHEYEEILAEDGTVIGYRCIFCQREIDEEVFEAEGAMLHFHIWSRPEGEILPICEACGTERFDCEEEDGYGIHIFELIQEEGQPDKYRCVFCGTEKEFLDAWDMTLELFEELMGISLYAAVTCTYKGETSDLPTNQTQLADYNARNNNSKIFMVSNLADLMALQALSINDGGFDFDGYTVEFVFRQYPDGVTGDGTKWDLTELKGDFKGLGSENAPFKGILTSRYDSKSFNFLTATPLLNYAATGAVVSELQINMNIEGDGGSPVGGIAAHVVRSDGDTEDTVTISEVSLSGKITNPNGKAGVLFGEVVNNTEEPIKLRYENGDVKLGIPRIEGISEDAPADVDAAYAGGLAGRTEGAVEVYMTDVFPMGTMTGTTYAGMLVGSMEKGGTLFVDGTNDERTVSVNGSGESGGLVGWMEGGYVRREEENDDSLTIKGSVTGRDAGGLIGGCFNTKIDVNHIIIEANITANQRDAGGISGQCQWTVDDTGSDANAGNLLHHIEIRGDVSGASNVGGVIGYIKGSNFRIGLPEEADNFECIRVSGNVSTTSDTSSVGGIIGVASGEYIEVYHATVSGGISHADAIGGIIGKVGSNQAGAVVKVKNAKVTSLLDPKSNDPKLGGIFGNVLKGSMAALDGTIDVAELGMNHSSWQRGHIAGKQEEALIYFEESCNYQRPEGKAWVDDIGDYGGVYRNGVWGEAGNTPLISYGEKKVQGTVTLSGSGWELDSEADVMRLAIMLNTEGRFAGNCFSGANKAALLGADYLLKKSEYNLSGSGIYALNRNDRKDVGGECFTGKLIGDGTTTLNLGDCVTYQRYLSLFPYAGNGAEFRNLTVKRKIEYAREAAAGLAAYAVNDIKVDNANMQVSLTGSTLDSSYLYGGMFANYFAGGAAELSVTRSRIGGEFNIGQSTGDVNRKHYIGGLLAKYTANTTPLPVIRIEDLEIAERITSSSRFASGMITQINVDNSTVDSVKDRVKLSMKDISVTKEAQISITDVGETGGFLGWKWFGIAPSDANYSIYRLTIGDGGTAGTGPSYLTRGEYGGLVHTITGRIQLKDIEVKNASFRSDPDGGSHHNGLLFHNGHNALIELEGYRIAGQDVGAQTMDYAANNAKVQVTGAVEKYSEIVGSNMGNNKNSRSYTNGGIVNIISPAFESDFVVYQSHLLDGSANAGSNNTRYYYNLFGTSLAGENTYLSGRKLKASALEITDADQMVIWHLSQYMNPSIRRYLTPYFDGGIPNKNAAVTIKGTIDLNKKSYYPTPMENGTINGKESAKIIFHGDKIAPVNLKLAEGGYTDQTRKENYMLHGGLLISPNGGMTVQGEGGYLTLSGKITRMYQNSGALFVMSTKGINKIYKIRLEDLYINEYGGATHECGLLIGAVEDGSDMDISWIETKGYAGSQRQTYAASALIGRVGSDGAKELKLDFTNIKVGDKNPDRNPSDKSEGIFRYATFIDKHQYTDNTQENKGRVRYLFTEEAYKGEDMAETGNATRAPFEGGIYGNNNYRSIGPYVTVGSELQNGVEYWNVDGDADLVDAIAAATGWSIYLPYVCTDHPENKDIQVNPKNAPISEGCGTYEDPYQISSAKQLLALSYYLINGNNQEYLENWQIREFRSNENLDGNGICEKNHTEATIKTYGDADFPTQEELRKAYYIIMKDIDFSELKSSGETAVVQSFVGLGTEKFPFSGVIVGKRQANGEVPTITLPYKRRGNTCDYFGLIEYAKGAVVKDIKIASPTTPADNLLTNVVRVKNSGGSVMACILGGDNIIDNVTAENRIAVDTGSGGMNAIVGGYVGTVQQGSLILRNLTENSLRGFQWGLLSGSNRDMESGAPTMSNYPYVSGVVGRVENGFVIYEGNAASASGVVLPHESKSIANIYRHALLPLSNTYDIITASGMASEKDKIAIASNGGNYTCHIDNAAQLQLVSMAINSDSFSVYYDGGGYDKLAACRKAKYDEVGNVTGATAEYTNATGKDDDVYWYPYIYQYFSFDTTSAENSAENMNSGFYRTLEKDSAGNKTSKLNAVTTGIRASMTYELKDDETKDISYIDYDLSVYGRGFRGLGATYRVFGDTDGVISTNMTPAHVTDDKKIYSDFRANFNGNGATVRAEMKNDYEKVIHTAALFNDLVYTYPTTVTPIRYCIENLVVTGTFRTNDSGEGNNSTNYAAERAAAVVGMMRRPWEIKNVTALNVDVWSRGNAAGIVAWINIPRTDEQQEAEKAFSFQDCKVLSMKKEGKEKGTDIHAVGGSSGGIIGIMGTWHNNALENYKLELTGCQVRGETNNGSPYYVYIENDGNRSGFAANDQEANGRGRCGALIGHVGKHHEGDANIATKITLHITGKGNSDMPDVQYVSLNGGDSTGGVLGEYYGWRQNGDDPSIKIADITVSDSVIESKNRNETTYGSFGIGGIIGKLQREATCEIKNANVINTNVRSAYGNMNIGAAITNDAPQGDLNAGGIIGYSYYKSRITIENVKVEGAVSPNGKPQYEISSRLSNAGGIIGASWKEQTESEISEFVTIKEAVVSGMNIVSDSRSQADKTSDRASGISTGAAGGVMGRASAIKALALQNISVENCVIRSGQSAAGGMIGNAASALDTVVEDATVSSCTIGSNGNLSDISDSMGMGGIYGRVSVLADRGKQKLKGIRIENCDIYGKNVGGIAGILDVNQQIGNVWSVGNTEKIVVERNRLLGYMTGGAFGLDKSRKTCFANVEITDNLIAAVRKDNANSAAGGFCGWKDDSADGNDSHDLNDITVEKNWIYSGNIADSRKQSAGGIFGYLNLTKEIYSYHASVKDNAIGYCDVASNNTVNSIFNAGMTGQMNAVANAMTAIKNQTAKLWNGSGFVSLPPNLKEEEIAKYSGYYGNLVGAYAGSGHAYFLMPAVAYADGTVTRPTVDVGSMTPAASGGNKMLSAPYAYRRNIHVIYHEPDGSNHNEAAEYWTGTAIGRDGLFSQVNVGAKLEEYSEAIKTETAATSKQLLDAYRLSIANETGNTVSDIYHHVYENEEEGYLSKVVVRQNGAEVKLPMIVLDTKYGTVDQLMTGVLAALTGAGGVHNSGTANKDSVYDIGMSEIMDISVEALKVENGVIKPDDTGRKVNLRWNDKRDGYDRVEIYYNNYDEEDENENGTTFSILTVAYKQKDYAAIDDETVNVTGGQIELRIPIFVVERLTIDTYLKMAEGEVYNADKAKAEGADSNPLLANDSTYTLYMEYIYGSARDKYSTEDNPICIDKTLGVTYMDPNNNEIPISLWPNTRLTLIDVCDSNKVYYYTVGENDTVIKFEQFRADPDDPASAYENKPIHGEEGMDIYKDGKEFPAEDREEPYTDVAVERFLIIVDTTFVDSELKLTTRNVRNYHMTPELQDNIKRRTTLTEHTDLKVTMQPGLTMNFVSKGAEGITDARGTIQDGEKVEINATFQIVGEKEYWRRALNSNTTTIDSANHNKYLEVGIYLTDIGENRVKLPDNTNVTVNGHRLKPWEEEIKAEENLGAYVNSMEVYFYRDGKIIFPLDVLKDIVQKDIDKNGYNGFSGVVSEKLKIELNFDNADMSEYTENIYIVNLELIRTEDSAYPAGGEVMDRHSSLIIARRRTDLACALETKDLMALGINTYQNQTPMPHAIDFRFKLDFNGLLSETDHVKNEQTAAKYYTVTYHILEKTNRNGTPVYEPYTGDQLSLELADPPSSDIQKTLQKGASSVGEFENSVYITYRFKLNEMKKGTDNVEKGVVTRDLALIVKDAEKMDLSNYKVVASVMVSDDRGDDIEGEVNGALSDFFVFTVAKLKTDLDY